MAKFPHLLTVDFRSELILRRHPIQRVVPDAWVEVRKGQGLRAFCFEIDRATEGPERIKRKLQGYCELDSSETYRERFGTELICVFLTTSRARLIQLCRLSQDYLKDRRRVDLTNLFYFGVAGETVSAEEFYFGPGFYQVGDGERWLDPEDPPVALLSEKWRSR